MSSDPRLSQLSALRNALQVVIEAVSRSDDQRDRDHEMALATAALKEFHNSAPVLRQDLGLTEWQGIEDHLNDVLASLKASNESQCKGAVALLTKDDDRLGFLNARLVQEGTSPTE
jgi:hypothetical protein